MGKINVLDMNVANLIAAGEVVERPASAIKELIENSIDAGARNITIEIKKGGVGFLRITDDGCGMTSEDAIACIRRHATSKIRTEEDLNQILTLGFRGEALAAISAVTNMRIMTCHEDENVGTMVSCEYGTVSSILTGGYPKGTTIVCEDLFAKTPARLKFLKNDTSEAAAVTSVVEKIAISKPRISFRYILDGETKFKTPGNGELKDAIYSVLGRDMATKLIEVSQKAGGIEVSGYVSSPQYVRGNRNMQIIYVNGRLIKSKLLQTAIDNAYNSYIPVGKFASCVLFLKVHTSDVDVNIHPSKLEVKFNKEKDVFDAIYYALRGALENKIERPTLNISSSGNNVLYDEKKMAKAFGFAPVEKEKVVQTSFFDSPKNDVEDKKENIENKPKENVIKIEKNDFEFDLTDSFKPSQNRDVFSKFNIDFPVIDEKVIEKEEIKPSTDAKLESFNKNVVPYYRIIGEAFETYVFVQVDSKLIVVDKHAAHERINYEKLRMNMSLECPNVQMLLTTIDISFTAEEIDAINNLKNEISKMGFEFDINDRVVSIKAIPIDMEQNDASELFQNLVSIAASNTASFDKERLSMFERALYQASCKASIKGGRHYDEVHIKWIIDNLFRYDCIKYCPHGRPVAFELTNQELDRKFRRE